MSKLRNYIEVMEAIPDNAWIGMSSLGMGGVPEQLLAGLGAYFQKNGSPRNINVVTTGGIGIGKGRGLDHLLFPDLLSRITGSYLNFSPNTIQAVLDNQVAMTFLPQGIISQLYRDSARKGIGVMSQVGLNTFIDPRQMGGKMNDLARQLPDSVSEIFFDGERWLHYHPLPINVAFIKGTYADSRGNISMKHEPHILDSLSIASAARNRSGIVIVQVEAIVEDYSIPAKEVVIPGAFVDYIVVSEPKYHMQTPNIVYDAALSNEIRVDLTTRVKPLPLSDKKVILRRAAQELKKNSFVNVGVGLAAQVSDVLCEHKLLDQLHLNVDLGAIGGKPVTGYDYGMNYNAESIIATQDLFNHYHGGGLDATILGFGEFDGFGNMNTTLLNGTLHGPGGMMDLTYGAEHIIFVGNFTIKANIQIENGQLIIKEEGLAEKFVSRVAINNFNGQEMLALGKEVTIITERAVFKLQQNGRLKLMEIAPGINLQTDILDLLPFSIDVAENLSQMPEELFNDTMTLVLKDSGAIG